MSARRSSTASPPASSPTPPSPGLRGATLAVTHLIKLSGAVVAVNEAFTARDAAVLALSAFMMAGAQVSETALLAIIDRFFGTRPA